MIYETRFLVSLILSLIIEVPLAVVIIKYIIKPRGVPLNKIIFVSALATILTLPYLWFVMPPYFDARYYILTGEIIVILVEALIFIRLLEIKFHHALSVSFFANLISYYIGIYLFTVLL